jgi:lipid-A-disaccharide synthase-like uncharacterized protein
MKTKEEFEGAVKELRRQTGYSVWVLIGFIILVLACPYLIGWVARELHARLSPVVLYFYLVARLTTVPVVLFFVARYVNRLPLKFGFVCSHCAHVPKGFELRALFDTGICPVCGQPFYT